MKRLLRTIPVLAFLATGTAQAQSPWVRAPDAPFTTPTIYDVCNETVSQLHMQVSGEGWVFYPQYCGRYSYAYYAARTTNNGQTWQATLIAQGIAAGPGVGGYTADDYWQLPNLDAFAIIRANASGATELQRKASTSSTWTTAFATAGVQPLLVRFFDNAVGFFLAKVGTSSNVTVYRTSNGGSTWTAQATLNLASFETLTPQSDLLLGNRVWFSTSLGNSWYSADQGQTWSTSSLNLYRGAKFSFRDAQNGLAYTDNGLLSRTTNGGQTWSLVPVSGPLRRTTVAAIPDIPNAYLSGGNGYFSAGQTGMALSVDNGTTWQTIEPSLNYSVIQAASSTRAWAVSGFNENAFLTTANVLTTKASKRSVATPAYPNPTNGPLHLPGGAGTTARVFDATGRLLRTSMIAADAVLDLSGLAPGLYQVQFTSKQGTSWAQPVSVAR